MKIWRKLSKMFTVLKNKLGMQVEKWIKQKELILCYEHKFLAMKVN